MVRSVMVRGLEGTGVDLADAVLPTAVGQPLEIERVESTRHLIGRRLAARGYAFARIEAVYAPPLPAELVDVVFEVDPGPLSVFGPTMVDVEAPLSVSDVRARLAYRGGDRFSLAALEHTVERLRRIPLVDDVAVELAPYRLGDSIVQTQLSVSTGPIQAIQGDGTVSSSQCVTARMRAARRHLFGSPRVLSGTLVGSNLFAGALRAFPCTGAGEGEFADPDYLARVELREPVGADTWLLLDVEASRETAPQAYIRRGFQLRAGAAHMLRPGTDLLIAVAPESLDHPAAGPIFCGVHGACDAQSIADLSRVVRVLPLHLELTHAARGAVRPPRPPDALAAIAVALPMWTSVTRLTAATGGTFGATDAAFGRAIGEVILTRAPGRRMETAARLRLGRLAGADEPLPPHLRLFGGGPLGVRAVAANRLGPLVLTTDTVELVELGCPPTAGGCAGVLVDPGRVRERPTGGSLLIETGIEARLWAARWIQVAAFLDAGAVRSGARPGAPAARVPLDPVIAPGLGVLALTPVGPLRVDLAYDPRPIRSMPLLVRGEADGWIDLGDVRYDPYAFDSPPRLREVWRRVRFQILMGNPF
jgi:translocation and assembly module TamA